MIKQILSFLLTTGIITFGFAAELPMTLSQYVKIYLVQDENYISSKIQYQISKENFNIASDLYQSTLSFGPVHGRSQYNISGIETEDESGRLAGQWSQSLASGSLLSLEAFDYYDSVDNSLTTIDRQYNFSIEQQLWRNSFGRADRRLSQSALYEFEQKQLELNQQKMDSCSMAIDLYSKAYRSQRHLDIYSQMLEEAKGALAISKTSFNKRMIRKIDLLSAESDYLQMHTEQKKAESEHQNQLKTMLTSAHIPFELKKLAAPEPELLSWEPNSNLSLQESLELKALSKARDSASSKLEAQDSLRKNDVRLKLEARRNEGRGSTNLGLADFREDFVGISLNLEWPIFNKSIDAKLAQAQLELALAENTFNLKIKEIDNYYSKAFDNSKLTKDLLKLHKEKMSIYKDQIREANRILRSGKIEFEEYLRYRDAFLNEQLKGLNLQIEYLDSKVQLANYSNKNILLCMETE